MKSPLTYYYSKRTEYNKFRKETYPYFENKYFKKPFQESGGLFETTERFLAKKLNFFLPGRIYTWQYDPIGKDVLDYYDLRPIVLVHSQFVAKGTGNMIVQGLNLNFFPEITRVQVLQLFYEAFEMDLNNAEQLIEKNQIGTMNRVWQYLINWYFVTNLFNKKGQIGYQWAYRNYIIDRMKTPVIVELNDWQLLPFFIPIEFNGKTPKEIWEEYFSQKNELSKKITTTKKSKLNEKKYTKPGGS